MKILYVTPERHAAQRAAHALRSIAPNCTLAWARTVDSALRWVRDNRDAAAVVLDRAGDGGVSARFVEQAGAINPSAPVIVGSVLRLVSTAGAFRQHALAQAGQAAEQRYASELAATESRLAAQQAVASRDARICTALQQRLFELEEAALQANARCTSLEQALAAEASASAARERELADAVLKADERCASLEQLRAAEASAAAARQRKLEDAQLSADQRYASLEQARAAEAAAAAARQRELEDALLRADERYASLEQARAAEASAAAARQRELEDTLLSADQRYASLEQIRAAEASAAAARQRELEDTLLRADERYASLEQARAAEASAAAARQRELEDTLLSADERYASLEQLRAGEAAAATARQRALEDALQNANERHASLEQARASEASASAARERELGDALQNADERYASLEQARAAEVSASATRERAIIAQSTAARRRALRIALNMRRRTRLQNAELEAQLARERYAHGQETITRNEELSRLQQGLKTYREELEKLRADAAARRREIDALRRDAEELPQVRLQLEESERERHRQFEDAPYALCRCTREGRITHLNEAIVRLLGYRRADDLRRVEFSSLLECADDLRWVIERSLSTRTAEAVETTMKTADRRRLHVRLRARATPTGAVEIAVQDTTGVRELERRLSQAQRMEAVGRLAAEVAETCDTLLRDVTHGGRQWLATVSADNALRHRGELLFGDVARAASFLRQFAVYGDRQISALEPVNVQRILQGLEPVLKRVAGDDIRLSLPKTPTALEVDVDANRLERILVNVTSYARERLPQGGRIDVDLGETIVDRRFIATYPGVRAGAHVLITVNHVPRPERQLISAELRRDDDPVRRSPPLPDKPGVDLGVLLELIRDCEGHLWMTAEPSGNMTLKIYLPKREADGPKELSGSASLSGRARPLARLFRH